MRINCVSILVVGFLSSCADQYKHQVDQGFKLSVASNATAKSHSEWELSQDNSIKIFKNLRENYLKLDDEKKKKFQSSVCNGLYELSNTNLLVFQDELNKSENCEVIGFNCQAKLLARINQNTSEQVSKFEYKMNSSDLSLNKPIDFKLETKIITLETVLTTKEMIDQLQDNEIVITFDDGPDGLATDSILKTLKSAGQVKAMFFTKGANIQALPNKIEREYRSGHVVANHSWNHYCLKDSIDCFNNNNPIDKNSSVLDQRIGPGILSDENVLNEIQTNFEIIKDKIKEVAPFFRFPYGEVRDSTSKYLKEHGVFEVGWNIDTNDWKKVQDLGIRFKSSTDRTVIISDKEQIPFTAQDVIDSAVRQLKLRKKGIILFHDIHIRTAEILPQFLYELHKLNFKVVQFKAKPIELKKQN